MKSIGSTCSSFLKTFSWLRGIITIFVAFITQSQQSHPMRKKKMPETVDLLELVLT
jgi:hypothetical protein